jgi:dienelactone hydrolase
LDGQNRFRANGSSVSSAGVEHAVMIPLDELSLDATLTLPDGARAVVVFAHGSGSSRHSPRNRFVAEELNAAGLGTLLMDLLTEREGAVDEETGELRFDIGLLAARLVAAIDWLGWEPATRELGVGVFGASTGGAAALVAAARLPDRVGAVVSRGDGRIWPTSTCPTSRRRRCSSSAAEMKR